MTTQEADFLGGAIAGLREELREMKTPWGAPPAPPSIVSNPAAVGCHSKFADRATRGSGGQRSPWWAAA